MTLPVTVADVHQMTPDVKQFRLVASDHTFEYRPGQHTHVHFEQDDGTEVSRPYTAITQPGTNQICLTIKRYPDGTASVWMHERSPGDEIDIEPVDGNLYVRSLDRDAVFLATGTGITPLYPMVDHYASEGNGRAHLLFGEHDRAHVILRESLDQLHAEHANLAVDYVLSESGASGDGEGTDGERTDDEPSWDGLTGHVQDHLPGALDSIETLDETDIYICGVPAMVVETEALLEDIGVDDEHIYTEGWEAGATDGDDG